MKNLQKLIQSNEFDNWTGFKHNFLIDELDIKHRGNGISGVPAKNMEKIFFHVSGYDNYISLYLLDNNPIKVLVEFPVVSSSDLFIRKLGEPDFKQDYYMDVSYIKKGEIVYLQKGIVVYSDPRNAETKIYKIELFNPCDLKTYTEYIDSESRIPKEF